MRSGWARRLLGPLFLVPLAFLGSSGCGGAGEPPATTPGQDPVGATADPRGTAPINPVQLGTGYKYIFRMVSPANDNFAITERAVYLYFWPDTTHVSFKLQNRLGTQMKILWDQCRFTTTEGITYRTIHSGVTYQNRNLPQAYTLVPGLGSYQDWLAPVELFDDPDAAAGGDMRQLFPTGAEAMSYQGKQFSVTFVLEIENVPQTFLLIFEVENVSPPQ
jgi:hypothetical protein